MAWHAMSIMPPHAMSWHGMSWHAMHIMPCHAPPRCHAMPCHAMPRHAIPHPPHLTPQVQGLGPVLSSRIIIALRAERARLRQVDEMRQLREREQEQQQAMLAAALIEAQRGLLT